MEPGFHFGSFVEKTKKKFRRNKYGFNKKNWTNLNSGLETQEVPNFKLMHMYIVVLQRHNA
jgi:hypothetical protein